MYFIRGKKKEKIKRIVIIFSLQVEHKSDCYIYLPFHRLLWLSCFINKNAWEKWTKEYTEKKPLFTSSSSTIFGHIYIYIYIRVCILYRWLSVVVPLFVRQMLLLLFLFCRYNKNIFSNNFYVWMSVLCVWMCACWCSLDSFYRKC